jgi:hypothetical protein
VKYPKGYSKLLNHCEMLDSTILTCYNMISKFKPRG